MKTPAVYVLYTGDLYGTERMAMATLAGLRDHCQPLIIARHGPAAARAAGLGLEVRSIGGYLQMAQEFRAILRRASAITLLATRFEQSLLFCAVNLLHRRRCEHFMVVHGGGGKNVYWRNLLLLPLPLRFIAVSGFVRECLVANGIPRRRITVIENFLSQERRAGIPQRPPFTQPSIRRVALVSRVVPDKRIELLLDSLDLEPRLAGIEFRIYGDGESLAQMKARAQRHMNVHFMGFDPLAAARLHQHDLLLHTAPLEPFGLVILEAMAARVPALVPGTGGPATMVRDGESGFIYAAGDARALADKLLALNTTAAAELNGVVANAARVLDSRFSEEVALARYRELLFGAATTTSRSAAASR